MNRAKSQMSMNQYQTSDLSLAAFLLMRGLKLVHAEKNKSGKFIFLFDDPDDRCKKLSLEFVNSEFCDYDNHIRNLKKVIYSK
ncbi:hypothetical protein CL634_09000 [bacterium]|nr:hypothetical protein [bacterium]|tara:strand:+ start:100 stop:348 length:249 start_codon:yes stop_codon:yes gene_type:complete